MESKKYEFTGETMKFCEHTLRRIRALVDINAVVKKGDLGGWIECEENLSQEGNCWVDEGCYVCDGAKVYEDAHVADGAKVLSGSEVYGNAYVGSYSEVIHNSKVYGSAAVTGGSLVVGAEVYGYATIAGRAVVENGAKVFDAAIVDYGATVSGKAIVRKTALVSGEAIIADGDIDSRSDFICVGPIGSRNAYTTYNLKTGTVCTGCFKGTLQEFKEQVDVFHGTIFGGNEHHKAYNKLITFFKTFSLRATEPEED